MPASSGCATPGSPARWTARRSRASASSSPLPPRPNPLAAQQNATIPIALGLSAIRRARRRARRAPRGNRDRLARRGGPVTHRRIARVAFARMGPHPIPNRLFPPELAAALAAEVEIFDVEAAARRTSRPDREPIYVLREFGRDLLRGRTRPWRAFLTTTWIFRRMSRLARRFVARGRFDLSFQIQSAIQTRALPGFRISCTRITPTSRTSTTPDFDRRTLRGEGWIALESALYDGSIRGVMRLQAPWTRWSTADISLPSSELYHTCTQCAPLRQTGAAISRAQHRGAALAVLSGPSLQDLSPVL